MRLPTMRAADKKICEARPEAEAEWIAEVNKLANANLRSTVKSWYLGANIPGKPSVFMPYIGGQPAYLAKCQEVVANGYDGFDLN